MSMSVRNAGKMGFESHMERFEKVKPECLTEKPQNLAKQQAGIDFCKERGMEYKILTERELEYS